MTFYANNPNSISEPITAELLRGSNVTDVDIQQYVSGSQFTIELRFRWEDIGSGNRSFLQWRDNGFGLLITDHSVNALATTATGEQQRFWRKASDMGEPGQHKITITADAGRDVFTVRVDDRVVIRQLETDLRLPEGLEAAAADFGSGLLAEDASASNALVWQVPQLKDEGLVYLQFFTDVTMEGLVFEGDAAIDHNGFLTLDGDRDSVRLTETYSLEGADYLSTRLWFRFNEPGNQNSTLVWNQGAFGLKVRDDALNAMVTTVDGRSHLYVGNLTFSDLNWHYLELNIDVVLDHVEVRVDGTTVLERYDLDLLLPSTQAQTYIGGTPWGGASLAGQIDNVVLMAKPMEKSGQGAGSGSKGGEPLPLQEAVGDPDPALAMNTGAYLKWDEYSNAPFIDRMKGAHEWTANKSVSHQTSGSSYVFNDLGVFDGSSAPLAIDFTSETILNLQKLLVIARFNQGILTSTQYQAILADPESYFEISTGADGKSRLNARLDANDKFVEIAVFDQDIGMDFAELRAAGHAIVSNDDLTVDYANLQLDENGWPMEMPTDVAGNTGTFSTVVMWYPEEAASAPDSIYAGRFYLVAEGTGTLDLTQKGTGPELVNLQGVTIDGPTVIPFDYTPNGERVILTLLESDPGHTGDYVRNIRIIHEDHWDLFEAGEIFTPEFVELHQDSRIIRWMDAMETNRNLGFADGAFEDRPGLDHYSFNLGTDTGNRNGIPIDAIIEFSNKTGSDPWINVPIDASDAYVQAMAEYIESHLDPRLKLYVELGNENWNASFDTYTYATQQALERWGELTLAMDSNGQFLRDAEGKLIVETYGRFTSLQDAQANGFNTIDDLTSELGITDTVHNQYIGWAEWTAMRATQVGHIFEQVFEAADPDTASARVNNVMGAQTSWSGSTQHLMEGAVWHEEEPGSWIDPATVFETLAIGAYFGSTTGSKDSDLVTYWIEQFGNARAADLLERHLVAGMDPAKPFIQLDQTAVDKNGNIDPNAVQTGVQYSADLIIDVSDAIYYSNIDVRNALRDADGVKNGTDILLGDDVANYARLILNPEGNSELQLRILPGSSQFQTIVEFDGAIGKTVEELADDGTLFLRSIPTLAETLEGRFAPQKAIADIYGLDVAAYEGGQHIAAATWGVFRANLTNGPLVDFLTEFNSSPQMGELYAVWLGLWQEAGGASFVQYSDYSAPSRFGNWGSLDYLGQDKEAGAETPKWDALNDLNDSPPWWDEERDPTAFLHGLTLTGTTADDALAGTPEEDILFGLDGNDILSGGPGNDSLHGGSGADTMYGGLGDDSLVIDTSNDTVDGGDGFDTVRLANSLDTIDFSLLSATNIEAIDARNAAPTTMSLSDLDVFSFNEARSLTLYAESADSILLSGFDLVGLFDVDGETHLQYEGLVRNDTVYLTIVSDLGLSPDIILAT